MFELSLQRIWNSRHCFASITLLFFALHLPTVAQTFQLIDDTSIVTIQQRRAMTMKAQQLAGGGYELAGGSYVSFAKWYEPKNPDLQFDFLTQLSPRAGILWGFSTGEYGEKWSAP